MAAFIACFILVANSGLPADRSRVNSLGQASVSVVRAIGPPLWTPIFAWSVSEQNLSWGWPLNYHFAWILCGVLALCVAFFTLRMPASLERKRLQY